MPRTTRISMRIALFCDVNSFFQIHTVNISTFYNGGRPLSGRIVALYIKYVSHGNNPVKFFCLCWKSMATRLFLLLITREEKRFYFISFLVCMHLHPPLNKLHPLIIWCSTSKENQRMLLSVCITAFAFDSVLCLPLWRSNAIEMAHICIKSTCIALELNFWAVLYFVLNVAVITKPALCSSFIVPRIKLQFMFLLRIMCNLLCWFTAAGKFDVEVKLLVWILFTFVEIFQ